MSEKHFTIIGEHFKGYMADDLNAPPDVLTRPSVNCYVTTDHDPETRYGFENTTWDLGISGTVAPTSFYHRTYDITFFAAGTKVVYVNHGNGNAVVDTGISLTSGTTTRFAEYAGDIYLTNTTDGLRRIVCMRLSGAASSGATFIAVDADGAARLSVFGITSGNLRINGTNEAFSHTGSISGTASASGFVRITTSAPHGIQSGATVTIASVGGTTEANGTHANVTRVDSTHFDIGVVYANAYTSGGTWSVNPSVDAKIALSGTASQSYADNSVAIFVSDISSGKDKFSKITFWKERMTGMGSELVTNADYPNANVFFGRFATAASLENIINFTSGAGATVEMVGKSGKVTNILPTEDYLYIFKERETYVIANTDVNTSSGASIPNLRSPIHGCLGEDCAADMGNGEISVVTPDKRFMRIKISTDSGAPVVFPDESYDVDIQKDLRDMDTDQTGALVWYWSGKRWCIHQVKINGRWEWRIYDNNIRAWQPPFSGLYFKSLFERNGLLYGTDPTSDTVYQIGVTGSDDTAAIECVITSGWFDIDDSIMDTVSVKGKITSPATIYVRTPIDSGSPQAKTVVGTDYGYGSGPSLGSGSMSSDPLASGGDHSDTADWKKTYDIYPAEGSKIRLHTSSFGDGHRYSIHRYEFRGRRLSDSFTPVS